MHVTWEPEGRLSQAIVKEFEIGQKVDTVQNTVLLYGTLTDYTRISCHAF